MSDSENNIKIGKILNELKEDKKQTTTWAYTTFSIFQTIVSILSLFLYFYCNKGKMYIGGLIAACCCPHIYIAYQLAMCVYLKKK